MKKFILLLFCVLLNSTNLLARDLTLSQKGIIEKVSLEDQTINLVGGIYKLSPEIRVLTKNNQLLSVSGLTKGYVIEFFVNPKELEKKTI